MGDTLPLQSPVIGDFIYISLLEITGFILSREVLETRTKVGKIGAIAGEVTGEYLRNK